MNYKKEIFKLIKSIESQEESFKNSLILNPVENVPDTKILSPGSTFLHGLYNSDKVRNDKQKIETKIQFSGRDAISKDVDSIYNMWSDILKAKKTTLRLLSGLHAHTVIFMCITNIGDKVMILPEKAGGHMATKQIFERLGLKVIDFCVDVENHRIDKVATIKRIKEEKPKIIFFDRSEGLVYENLSWLKEFSYIYKIFDASQYLTNIIANDYQSPFEMGFDAILSTLHKNLPGPQRALYASKKDDEMWAKIHFNIGTYVSNMHVFSIYSSGLLLENTEKLYALSKNMIDNTILLENSLLTYNIPVIKRVFEGDELYTHHIWIPCENKKAAFRLYVKLEDVGILVNYRKLPYEIGYGLRLGLSAATNCGLNSTHIEKLATYISHIYFNEENENLREDIKKFILEIKR